MNRQKRVAAIHDLSGFGKCSLTVALPVISAAGIECACLPTAVLSTHTGGFEGYTFRDLTEDLWPIAKHWESVGLEFDALYTGYLGSMAQLDIVAGIVDTFKKPGTLVVVDPVMADHGKFYYGFDEKFAAGMRSLCERADVIVPNFTEAAFLLGEEYHPAPYDRAYVEALLKRLSALGPTHVVLTGVDFGDGMLGAASYNAIQGVSYTFHGRTPASYHGTGDVFASALVAGLVKGHPLDEAVAIAVDFVTRAIEITYRRDKGQRYGVDFEVALPHLAVRLQDKTEEEENV